MAYSQERRRHFRFTARRPITIYTDRGAIEGESRNITHLGIFLRCKERLRKNEVYRMVINLPLKQSIEVKGRLLWSNLEGVGPASSLSGMGFSFMKFSEEDCNIIGHAFSAYCQ